MNNLTLALNKFNFKVELIEKTYFYTDGKITRTLPFHGGEKMVLHEVSGDSLQNIIIALNKQYHDKSIVMLYVDKNGEIVKEGGRNGSKVRIQCLII